MHELSIEITHECPGFCRMCSSSADFPSPHEGNELTIEEIHNLIEEGKKLGAKCVSLSGGEPTQKEGIMDILDHIHNNNMEVLYYTCGIYREGQQFRPLSDLLLRKLSQMKSKLIFDMQASSKRVHDNIMQVDNAWDMALDTLKRARDLGIELETHFVPQRDNYWDIPNYVYKMQSLGVNKCSFLRLVPQGRASENDVNLTKKQFTDVQEYFIELKNDNKLKTKIRLGHPIDRRWMLDPEGDYPNVACRGGEQAPLITPLGHIHECPAYKDLQEFSAGNIRENTLEEIWNGSNFYDTLRWFVKEGYKYMENECADCDYLEQCKGGCVAQRLLELKKTHNTEEMSFKDALLKSPPDPLCLLP